MSCAFFTEDAIGEMDIATHLAYLKGASVFCLWRMEECDENALRPQYHGARIKPTRPRGLQKGAVWTLHPARHQDAAKMPTAS
jgi:hypothetical protein